MKLIDLNQDGEMDLIQILSMGNSVSIRWGKDGLFESHKLFGSKIESEVDKYHLGTNPHMASQHHQRLPPHFQTHQTPQAHPVHPEITRNLESSALRIHQNWKEAG